jgi:ankyrin repeat protein
LEKDAYVATASKDGWTPLHLASRNNNLDVVNRLLVGSTDGWTPLHLAAQNGHLDVVNRLIELKVDAGERSNDGRTSLHLACLNGHLDVVNRLIELKADAAERSNDGWTPLHLAAQKGHLDVVSLLCSENRLFQIFHPSRPLKSLHTQVAQSASQISMVLRRDVHRLLRFFL